MFLGACRTNFQSLLAPFRLVLRARIVAARRAGTASRVIAERICEDTAGQWRRLCCEHSLDGLADAPRVASSPGPQERVAGVPPGPLERQSGNKIPQPA